MARASNKVTNPTQYDEDAETTPDLPEGNHYVVKHAAIGVGKAGPKYQNERFHEDDYEPDQIRRLLAAGAIVRAESDEGQELHAQGNKQDLWNTSRGAVMPNEVPNAEPVPADVVATPVVETPPAE